METSYDALRKVQLQEKSYSQLSQLPEGFFETYRVFLLQQRERLRDDFSVEAATVYENARKLMLELVRRRQKKIFLKALGDFEAGTVDGAGLASEEKELYSCIVKLLSQYEEQQFGSFGNKAAAGGSARKPAAVTVRFLVDLPAFVGTASSLGPFSAAQRADLPAEDAKLLIEKGVAQEA